MKTVNDDDDDDDDNNDDDDDDLFTDIFTFTIMEFWSI